MSTNDDKRLQALFQMIGGSKSVHEIATAVQKIKDHLYQTGRTFGDLAITAKDTSTTSIRTIDPAEVAEVLRRSEEVLRETDETVDRIMGRDPRSRAAQKKLRRAEIQRDVLASFVSHRVHDVAMLQAQNMLARLEAGESIDDVNRSFGRPSWSGKTGTRTDAYWG